MTHRFVIEPAQRVGNAVAFSAAQAHQLRSVLRLGAGDLVRVFDGHAPHDLLVRLSAPDAGTIEGMLPQPPEPRTRLVVYPALLQRDKFEQVLQKVTEIGAAAIVPVLTARGLVREAPDAPRQARWRAILREAAEQCGRGVVPALRPAQRLPAAFLNAASEGLALIAYEGERHCSVRDALQDHPLRRSRSIAHSEPPPTVSVFVGPEGGFTPVEAELAVPTGAHLVTLGPRILRSETASPLLAALVLYELGDLSSGSHDHVD